MYGVEAATGLGGLAAQAAGGDRFLPSAMAIQPQARPLAGMAAPQTGVLLPHTPAAAIGGTIAKPVVSASGGAVEHPAGNMLNNWRQILDWHNSPAPWILVLLLVLYGWLHISVRAGHLRAST